MLLKLPQLDVTRLAADYSAAVRAAHSDLELAAIVDRNAREMSPDVDHVHDYTDANDLMAGAVSLQLGKVWDWAGVAHDVTIAQQRARRGNFRLSRILVACEWSATLRDELTARGHSATSCDLLPTATPGNHHQGDVREILNDGWHMMFAFPPCTYLTGSALWRCRPEHDKDYPARQLKSDEALEFVRDLFAAPITKKCLENPRGRIGSAIRKADQEIQPYDYGHDASKTTGLWLENLPRLVADPANHVAPRIITYKGKQVKRWANQTPSGADKRGPSATRGHDRGKTYAGIARALADQMTGILAPLHTPPPANQLELFA